MKAHDRAIRLKLNSLRVSCQQWIYTFGPWLILCVLWAVAILLRSVLLDTRAIHADEAENAFLLARDLEGGNYVFNPGHHHGPTLHQYLMLTQRFTNADSFESLSLNQLRWSVLVLSMMGIASLSTFIRLITVKGVIFATLVLSLSSYHLYYSTYVIHEMILVLMSLGLTRLLVREEGKSTWLRYLGIGVCVGMLLSTKITALILLFSWAVAWTWAFGFSHFKAKFQVEKNGILLSVGVATLLCLWFYSSGFQNLSGIWDAIRSPFVYETQTGHEKPWHYFLTQFFLPYRNPPLFYHETLLLGFAALGTFFIWRKQAQPHAPRTRTARFMASSALLQVTIYSLISYKTPWLLLVTWAQLAVLAGVGFSVLWESAGRVRKSIIGTLILVLLAIQMGQNAMLGLRYHSDSRNPFSYVATSANIQKLPDFISRYLNDSSIAVYGESLWPLHWYLRTFDAEYRDAYDPIDQPSQWLVLNDQAYDQMKMNSEKNGQYRWLPYSLRANVPIYLGVPIEQWQQITHRDKSDK